MWSMWSIPSIPSIAIAIAGRDAAQDVNAIHIRQVIVEQNKVSLLFFGDAQAVHAEFRLDDAEVGKTMS